jgi:glycerol-3-phosphate responsive antiterminator
VEKEEAAIDRQRRGKHISAATNQQETMEELLETEFSVLFLRGYIARINEKIYCHESRGTQTRE